MKRRLAWMVFLTPVWLLAQNKNPIHLKTPLHISKYSDVQATTRMNVFGQDFTYAVTANMQMDYDFLAKNDKGYDLSIMLAAINTQLSSDGVTMSFNSTRDTANVDTIFAKPLSDILGKTDKMTIDSFGYILSSDTSDLHKRANEYLTSTLLLGNDYTAGHRLDLLFNLGDSVAIGESWTDSVKITGGQRIDTFMVDKVLNNVVYISSRGTVSRNLQIKQGEKKMEALFEGTTEGRMQVASATGLINSRNMQLKLHSQVQVNGQSIPINSEVTLNEHIQ